MPLTEPTADMLEVLAQPLVATLGTEGPHGPHLAPIWFEYIDGSLLVVTPEGSQKAVNITRSPRVGFSVNDERGRTVMMNGVASLEPMVGTAALERIAIHYRGPDSGKRYVEARSPDARSVVITITPERWMTYGM
jgi:PPOX class probable F420-dependent enzyme